MMTFLLIRITQQQQTRLATRSRILAALREYTVDIRSTQSTVIGEPEIGYHNRTIVSIVDGFNVTYTIANGNSERAEPVRS